MVNEITEEEVRNDVMVFANVLFERGMTEDPLGIVDAWGQGMEVGRFDSIPCCGRQTALEGRRP